MAIFFQASKENVMRQITNGKVQLKASGRNSEDFALIIDGKSLAYALEDDMKDIFLELAIGCASVICCRSSPKQKALVSSYLIFHLNCHILSCCLAFYQDSYCIGNKTGQNWKRSDDTGNW